MTELWGQEQQTTQTESLIDEVVEEEVIEEEDTASDDVEVVEDEVEATDEEPTVDEEKLALKVEVATLKTGLKAETVKGLLEKGLTIDEIVELSSTVAEVKKTKKAPNKGTTATKKKYSNEPAKIH